MSAILVGRMTGILLMKWQCPRVLRSIWLSFKNWYCFLKTNQNLSTDIKCSPSRLAGFQKIWILNGFFCDPVASLSPSLYVWCIHVCMFMCVHILAWVSKIHRVCVQATLSVGPHLPPCLGQGLLFFWHVCFQGFFRLHLLSGFRSVVITDICMWLFMHPRDPGSGSHTSTVDNLLTELDPQPRSLEFWWKNTLSFISIVG